MAARVQRDKDLRDILRDTLTDHELAVLIDSLGKYAGLPVNYANVTGFRGCEVEASASNRFVARDLFLSLR